MAEENRDSGYRRIQGATSNLGHSIARSHAGPFVLSVVPLEKVILFGENSLRKANLNGQR